MIGLDDTEKKASRYIVKVFIMVIEIITILYVNHKINFIEGGSQFSECAKRTLGGGVKNPCTLLKG